MKPGRRVVVILLSVMTLVVAGAAVYIGSQLQNQADVTPDDTAAAGPGQGYTNICGCGTAANCQACAGCNTGSFSCSGGAWAVRFTCNGRQTECRSNEEQNVRNIDTSRCGVTQQVDVFSKNCRAGGGWSCGDTDLVSYLVYYTGDCTGPAPAPAPAPAAIRG
ncbi:MAG: hypothetical protein TR69_WS6001001254 [candidate division WS6 bacterium OLB20]|uniref:Uncharacterized protein n=1 Tax=candidate division WS6 bacterium OLB20 TaxID=1617426 RepID=A0A136LWD8_9BACT|nr:MAG: hypothetical protein TR69_WS6001001254 [candidate division WS6 bacterium OLB20]